MFAPRARVRRRPASRQPTPSSRRRDRDPSPVWLRVPCRHLRGDGADAERARVVAAVAAAERAQQRAEKRAERAMFAPRARVRRRPASRQPTPSSRRRDRDPSPVWLRVPCRHLRGDGADAERARVVAAVAAAERAQERAEKRAERAMFAPRARVRRRPASRQPTPSSRRRDRDPSPVWLRVPCRHLRGDGADAERARVVAAVAAAERAQQRAEKRAERAMFAPRARVRRRPASRQPTPSSRRRDRDPSPVGSACLAVTSEATALTPSERESSPP